MKNYPQIIRRVYGEPWLIQPSAHRSIVRLLQSRLEGAELAMAEEGLIGAGNRVIQQNVGAAVVPVHGILGKHLSLIEEMCGGCSIDTLAQDLEAAAADPAVNRIIMAFNTPGGAYPGIPELARMIQDIDRQKPVYAFIDPLCCSGGQWLASACREIFALGSSTVGSVGVYSIYFDETAALEMEGVKVNAISAGKDKLMGASFKAMTDEERATLQAEVDRIHSEFKAAVNARRTVPAEYMEGGTYSAEEGAKGGLVTRPVDALADVITLTNN